jgi:hypothetical protein
MFGENIDPRFFIGKSGVEDYGDDEKYNYHYFESCSKRVSLQVFLENL